MVVLIVLSCSKLFHLVICLIVVGGVASMPVLLKEVWPLCGRSCWRRCGLYACAVERGVASVSFLLKEAWLHVKSLNKPYLIFFSVKGWSYNVLNLNNSQNNGWNSVLLFFFSFFFFYNFNINIYFQNKYLFILTWSWSIHQQHRAQKMISIVMTELCWSCSASEDLVLFPLLIKHSSLCVFACAAFKVEHFLLSGINRGWTQRWSQNRKALFFCFCLHVLKSLCVFFTWRCPRAWTFEV